MAHFKLVSLGVQIIDACAEYQVRHGRLPHKMLITKEGLEQLVGEVGYVLLEPGESQPRFNGVLIEVVEGT